MKGEKNKGKNEKIYEKEKRKTERKKKKKRGRLWSAAGVGIKNTRRKIMDKK